MSGDAAPTLFSLLDGCTTAAGSRLLRAWLTQPLRSQAKASARHDAIDALRADGPAARALVAGLKKTIDVERVVGRIALRNARPRDLAGLRDTLARLPELRATAAAIDAPLLHAATGDLAVDAQWATLLARAIAPEPAALVRDGGVIATGFDAELDELRAIDAHCGEFLVALEARERERTGIANLKVEYNRVHGFYIEVTNTHVEKIPDDYRRRQTLKNAERYITPELKTFEDKALSAQERALAREKWLFERLLDDLAPAIPALQARRQALATLDVLANLAERADALRLTRPTFVAEPGITIRGGRHPVVERQVESFIPNDVALAQDRRLLIVTGPNMGGKSTYMRQTAVVALLAYCGIDVPARQRDARTARRDLHAHRRVRRPGRRPLDVHGRDDRGRVHPESRDAGEPGADRRDRPRHVDVRRAGAGVGDRAPAGGAQSLPVAVRDALLRTDGAGGRAGGLRQRAFRRRRAQGRHRVPACGRGRPGQPQLRPAGGETGGRARGDRAAGQGLSRAARPVLGAQRGAGRSVRQRGAGGTASAPPPTRARPTCWRSCSRSIPTRCRRARRSRPSTR